EAAESFKEKNKFLKEDQEALNLENQLEKKEDPEFEKLKEKFLNTFEKNKIKKNSKKSKNKKLEEEKLEQGEEIIETRDLRKIKNKSNPEYTSDKKIGSKNDENNLLLNNKNPEMTYNQDLYNQIPTLTPSELIETIPDIDIVSKREKNMEDED